MTVLVWEKEGKGEKEGQCAVYMLNGQVKEREVVLFRRGHNGCG